MSYSSSSLPLDGPLIKYSFSFGRFRIRDVPLREPIAANQSGADIHLEKSEAACNNRALRIIELLRRVTFPALDACINFRMLISEIGIRRWSRTGLYKFGFDIEPSLIKRKRGTIDRARRLLGRQTQVVDIISSVRVHSAETLASYTRFCYMNQRTTRAGMEKGSVIAPSFEEIEIIKYRVTFSVSEFSVWF